MSSILYEKYKPQVVDDLVLPEDFKTKFKKYIKSGSVPNIALLSSTPGTGKSSSAYVLLKELDCEALWINASLERNIDLIRGKVMNFASQVSFDDKLKVVVFDEFDNLSKDAQLSLRGFLDSYSDNCRFIITGNYKEKIITPLLNRLEIFDFNTFDKKQMVKPIFEKLRFILDSENIDYDPKSLVPVINTFYPSIRQMIGSLQKFSNTGKFEVTSNLDGLDVFDKVMITVKNHDFNEMIEKVNLLNAPDSMYSYLYKNMSMFKNQPNALILIAKYQHMSESVRDKNLNLSACLSEIQNFID